MDDLLLFSQYVIIPCMKFRSLYPSKAQQPQEQRYPFLSVCAVVSCVMVLVMAWLPMFGILNTCARELLMPAIAHGGCTETVRESALEVDFGEEKKKKKKIPCCTGDSDPLQHHAWLFNRTFYQLSYQALPLFLKEIPGKLRGPCG